MEMQAAIIIYSFACKFIKIITYTNFSACFFIKMHNDNIATLKQRIIGMIQKMFFPFKFNIFNLLLHF